MVARNLATPAAPSHQDVLSNRRWPQSVLAMSLFTIAISAS